MKFYEYKQNNSGGYFHINNKVCGTIFIEADSSDEANRIAEQLGCYWDGCDKGLDCTCCGDRWRKIWDDDRYVKLEQFNNIEEYAQYWANEYSWTEPAARIYYKNGTVKEIYRTTK